MRLAVAIVAACAWANPAAAEEIRLCGSKPAPVAQDGRLLNHLPYQTASRSGLVRPRGLPGQCQGLQPAMQADLSALLARAHADPEIGNAIIAMSCFRSTSYQAGLFCRHNGTILTKAYQVAPPGYSEHSTGFAIDFGDRRGGACNLEICFANTRVGRWLIRNAPDFGFEMSFPLGNAQGVSYEPWHWRWVGRGDAASMPARTLFAAARERFPVLGQAVSASATADPASLPPQGDPQRPAAMLIGATIVAPADPRGSAKRP
jgi:D-alanyl-D-alanine carboxypeptidase